MSTYRRGFTVIEVLVVLAVASVLFGIAIPSFLAWLPGLRLSSAARQVATDLQLARMKAISENTSYTVTFDPTTVSYTFTGQSRDIDELYPGITLALSGGNPTFTPRGTANTVTITLSNGAQRKLVCVTSVGRINIRDSSCT
jgi:prepilin-type N-terminal cleavage/methylation domain-containing protein